MSKGGYRVGSGRPKGRAEIRRRAAPLDDEKLHTYEQTLFAGCAPIEAAAMADITPTLHAKYLNWGHQERLRRIETGKSDSKREIYLNYADTTDLF